MKGFAPCGACRAYVPVTGCPHWRPGNKPNPKNVAWQVADRRARARAVEAVADFRRMTRLNDT